MLLQPKHFVYAVVIFGLASFGLWFKAQRNDEGVARSPSAAIMSSTTPVQSTHPTSSSATPTWEPSASPTPSPLYRRFTKATNLGAAYIEFAAMAQGNPEAEFFQATVFLACSNYVGLVLASTEKNLDKDKLDSKRLVALNKLKTSCSDLPTEAFKTSWVDLLRDAATRGDAKAKATLLLTDNPKNQSEYLVAMRDAQTLANTKDPVVLDGLAGYFDSRDSLLQWRIPGVEGTVSGAEMGMAFRLAACDYGLDCSANTPEALAACARAGRCDYVDRQSDIQNQLMTPNAFNRAQAVRSVIAQGLATRNWPDGFWSGSNGGRR